jgi:hypothetical protein
MRSQLAEPLQVITVDVVLIALGEAVDEHGSRFHSVKDDCPNAAGWSQTWPSNALIPRSASIKPCSAREITSHRASSTIRCQRENRAKPFVV